MPTGLTGYTISSVDNGIKYGTTYSAGKIVPANTPLLLHGKEGIHFIYYTTSKATAAGTNLLQRSTGEEVSDPNTFYYKFTYRSSTDKTLGFFWDSDDGHSINIASGKAYLALSQEEAQGAKGFSLDGTISGIAQITPDNSAPEFGQIVYDMNGRAHTYSRTMSKGVYVTNNGRKFVIK